MNTHTPPPSLASRSTPDREEYTDFKLSPLLRGTFYAFMFSIPYDVVIPSWVPTALQGNLSIPRILGIMLSLIFILDKRLRPWKLPPAFFAFSAFVLIFAVLMLRSDFSALILVLQQIQLLVLFLIAYNLFLTNQIIRGSLLSFSISCGISSVLILTGATVDVFRVDALSGRITGFGADPNLYSGILLVGALAALGIGYFRKEKSILWLPILWAIIIVTVSAIALSGSRGSSLALILGLAAFILGKGSFWFQIRKLVAFAVVSGLGLWIMINSPILADRWQDTFMIGTTFATRDKIALEAIKMVSERPIIGWGLASKNVLAASLGRNTQIIATHNMILTILTLVGIIGSLPYFLGYWAVFRASWRARNGNENILPAAIFLSIFITDMVCGGLPDKLHWTFFAYILAMSQLNSMAVLTPLTNRSPSENTG